MKNTKELPVNKKIFTAITALQKISIPELKWLKHLTINKAFSVFLLVFFSSCSSVQEEKIEPKLSLTLPQKRIQSLPSSFTPLSDTEKETEWGKEYYIGQKLAQKMDLYRAITAFKRAEILIPRYLNRVHEIEYFILLSYYLGEKYQEALDTFEQSGLIGIDSQFLAYRDLLIILKDCFHRTKKTDKAALVMNLIEEHDQKLSQVLKVSYAMSEFESKNLQTINQQTEIGQDASQILTRYHQERKSEFKAQFFNALVPGTGYLYLGQKQAALTAFLLNGLTTYAAYYFFKQGNLAAGVIMASIESGWYFGGINGVKESAKLYNERLYEQTTQPIMQKHALYPILNLTHAF